MRQEQIAQVIVSRSLTAHDNDPGDRVQRISIIGDTSSAFSINETTGQIICNYGLDYEQLSASGSTPVFTFVLMAEDTNGGTTEADVEITITRRPELSADSYSGDVPEDAMIGRAILTVTPADPNLPFDSYQLFQEGTEGTKFAIDSSGKITVAGELNFEVTSHYTLTVRADACGGTVSDTATVEITIGNVAPVFRQHDYTFSLPENADSTLPLGSVAADDPHGGLGGYAIVDGDPENRFFVEADGTIRISASTHFDYESEPRITLRVQATDGSADDTATVTINVQDRNDRPLATALTLLNTTQADAIEGISLSGTDEDRPVQALTPSIVSGPSHGGLVQTADGTWRYVPQGTFYGDHDQFTYRVSDGELFSDPLTVSVYVVRKDAINQDTATTSGYVIGSDAPEKIVDDLPGATGSVDPDDIANPDLGWNSEWPQNGVYDAWVALTNALSGRWDAGIYQAVLNAIAGGQMSWSESAMNHLRHFVAGEGGTYNEDMAALLSEDLGAWIDFSARLQNAIAFVDSLEFVGTIPLIENEATLVTCSSKGPGSAGWYEAIGRYTSWGSGSATGTLLADGRIQYRLEFAYHLWDPYDWNPAGSTLENILAHMHLQGLAKQYLTTGVYNVNLTWIEGGATPRTPVP